jgi:hypothetical protein
LSSYVPVAREEFIDDQGNSLALILDSNGVSWHLWSEYLMLDGHAARWPGYWMPTLEGGKIELERSVVQLLEWGWRYRTAN